jgi:hypothetical protein
MNREEKIEFELKVTYPNGEVKIFNDQQFRSYVNGIRQMEEVHTQIKVLDSFLKK